MSEFSDKLFSLTAKEMMLAKKSNNADLTGEVIENIARALGSSIAIAVNGDPAAIDEMMQVAEAYAHSEAVEKSKFARLFEELARK